MSKSTTTTFDKGKASRIAQAVADCADKGGQVRTMRERLLAEFKGMPRRALDDAQTAMVKDALHANISARTTVAPKSVGPMVSTAAKIAKWVPCMLGMETATFTTVADSYAALAKFATAVKDAEGDTDAAQAALKAKAKRKDYPKAAASHIRALLGMKDGKFLTPECKALLVAFSDAVKLPVGELADEARSVPKAKKAFATVT
jgi:hypothetical protein